MTGWTGLPTEEAFITLRALGRVALTHLISQCVVSDGSLMVFHILIRVVLS